MLAAANDPRVMLTQRRRSYPKPTWTLDPFAARKAQQLAGDLVRGVTGAEQLLLDPEQLTAAVSFTEEFEYGQDHADARRQLASHLAAAQLVPVTVAQPCWYDAMWADGREGPVTHRDAVIVIELGGVRLVTHARHLPLDDLDEQPVGVGRIHRPSGG